MFKILLLLITVTQSMAAFGQASCFDNMGNLKILDEKTKIAGKLGDFK